jgi:phenylacetate-CoA ligase
VPPSSVPGIVWPALPGGTTGLLLATLYQLETSQYLPAEELRARQFRQLAPLVAHALKTVPYYRTAWTSAGVALEEPITPARWARLPILTRRQAQEAGATLRSDAVPSAHGNVASATTTGSTGMPLTVSKTALTQFFWDVFTLREERWHGRDLSAKLAAIRNDDRRPAGHVGLYESRFSDWGPPVASTYPTGPASMLDIRSSLAEQVEWLRREAPAYLLTFGLNLLFLARYCREHAIALPSLRGVRSSGEVLAEGTREACRAAWGVDVVDVYSAVEAGYIALQCPAAETYHVQAENALVEILDGDGRPCAPGEVGRVIVTPLHNYATPLIRYEIGDFAEVGAPCPCGRSLPTLTRILGRTREMLLLPSGEERFPYFLKKVLAQFGAIIQHQIVQRSRDHLEVVLAARAPLAVAEEERLRHAIRDGFGHPFRVTFTYCEEIPRAANGKYQEFRREVSAQPGSFP